MPRILVTIPSYKQPAMLKRALIALTHQTFKDFKVLIIDDCSQSNVGEYISKFKALLDISVVANEQNLGAMNNLYKSITIATECDYVFSHHEDDFIKTNYLEIALEILDNNKDISFVLSAGEWLHRDSSYIEKKIRNKDFKKLNQYTFIDGSLDNEHYIFGSVIYRKSDLVYDWGFATYNTLCDKYFLISILKKNTSCAGYLTESGIFERDHSLDIDDVRGSNLREDHAISYFYFLQQILLKQESKKIVSKKITNSLLLMYSSLPVKSTLVSFYKKQKPFHLITISHIRKLGVYAIITMHFSQKVKLKLIKLLK